MTTTQRIERGRAVAAMSEQELRGVLDDPAREAGWQRLERDLAVCSACASYPFTCAGESGPKAGWQRLERDLDNDRDGNAAPALPAGFVDQDWDGLS